MSLLNLILFLFLNVYPNNVDIAIFTPYPNKYGIILINLKQILNTSA